MSDIVKKQISIKAVGSRIEANALILGILVDITKHFPDWRFHQILMNTGIENGKDNFYEESIRTLELLLSNDIVSQYYQRVD